MEKTDLTEKTLATERKYTGKIISVDLLDVELPDGRKAKREVIRHGNAVAILARRPDGKFVFVKQYRLGSTGALELDLQQQDELSHEMARCGYGFVT